MPTVLAIRDVVSISVSNAAPKIISCAARHFTIQPGPGITITGLKGSINNAAVQAEASGGNEVAGTWDDVVGGASIAPGALKVVEVDVSALKLTTTGGNGTVFFLFDD